MPNNPRPNPVHEIAQARDTSQGANNRPVERREFSCTDINCAAPRPQNRVWPGFFYISTVTVTKKMSHKSNFPSTSLIFGGLGSLTSFFWLRFPYFLLQKQGYILVYLQMPISSITEFSSHRFSVLRPDEKEVHSRT